MQNAEFQNKAESNINVKVHQIFQDEVTFEKVHRHLSDINDQITDQDILNIKTEMAEASQIEFEKSAGKAGFSNEEIRHSY